MYALARSTISIGIGLLLLQHCMHFKVDLLAEFNYIVQYNSNTSPVFFYCFLTFYLERRKLYFCTEKERESGWMQCEKLLGLAGGNAKSVETEIWHVHNSNPLQHMCTASVDTSLVSPLTFSELPGGPSITK